MASLDFKIRPSTSIAIAVEVRSYNVNVRWVMWVDGVLSCRRFEAIKFIVNHPPLDTAIPGYIDNVFKL